jgi:WD40 repeat protein/tRNA A-37 threonylcarbamoyl transferase component Bud32
MAEPPQQTLPLPPHDPGDDEIGAEPAGRYLLGREIGRGGQARVLLATDRQVGRSVAWKELLPAASRAGSSDDAARERFLREARVTGQLEHPAIVPVHELGRRADGSLYYTMRLVRGESLAARLERCKGLDDRLELLGAFWDMCNAIAFAHSRGVIHRDLKPANVMVGAFGETVVLDWGLAKVRGTDDLRGPELEQRVRLLRGSGSATVAGWAVGTPSYMSPEQADGRIDAVDERSDVWGLGAVLYEILTGRPPFVGTNPYHVVAQVRTEAVAPVLGQCAEAPPELAAVAGKALQRDPAQRYQSAAELAEEVAAFMTGRRVRAYEYSSWELIRRFAARNRAAVVAGGAVAVAVLASLVLVSLAWQSARAARDEEHVQRLAAHFTLAQAHQLQADRLIRDQQPLAARIFAAASLLNNPANPSGPHHDRGFSLLHPEAERLLVRATSRLYQAEFRPVERLTERIARADGLMDVAWSPDGRLLATAEYGKGFTVRDVAAHRDLLRVPDRGPVTYSVAFLPDGRHLAVGGREPALQVWDLDQGRAVLTIDQPDLSTSFVAVSPDGALLASRGIEPASVALWRVADGSLVRLVAGREARAVGAAFSPDGRSLAIASMSDPVRVVDPQTGTLRFEVAAPPDAYAYWACFSPDGGRLLTAHTDGSARLWDTASGQPAGVLRSPDDSFYYAAFSPDGARVATAGSRGSVRLWSVATGHQLALLADHRDAVSAVAFSPDGHTLASAGYDRFLRLWTLRDDDGLWRWRTPGEVRSLTWVPGGQRLATLGEDGTFCLWERRASAPLYCVDKGGDQHGAMAVAPGGETIALGGAQGRVTLFTAQDGRLVREIQAHEVSIWALAYSPDGRLLATGSADRTARLWDLASGNLVATLTGPSAHLWRLAFSDDGTRLAAVGGAEPIYVWDVASGALVRSLVGHTDWVNDLRWLPDGTRLVSGGRDGAMLLWDIDQGRVARRFEGHEAALERLSLHAAGGRLASVDRLGTVMLWDIELGEPTLWLLLGRAPADIALSPDGRELALSEDDAVVVYPLDNLPSPQDPAGLLSAAEADAALELDGFELE